MIPRISCSICLSLSWRARLAVRAVVRVSNFSLHAADRCIPYGNACIGSAGFLSTFREQLNEALISGSFLDS